MSFDEKRLELMFGDALDKIKNANILLFGLGGVGGYVCEALVRSGISNITIVDNDMVSPSNINRQIIATTKTIGKYKCDLLEERIKEINPSCNVIKKQMFYLPELSNEFDFSKYDYVIDCIDTIKSKISIIENAYNLNVKVISAMGAANKLNPLDLVVTDIYKTKVDPLARVMRYELKKRNIKKLKVVYSIEEPRNKNLEIDNTTKKPIQPSYIAVPATMGFVIASEVIKDLIK